MKVSSYPPCHGESFSYNVLAEIPFVLGSYTDLQPKRPISANERAAASMLQDAVGAFVRDPEHGLSEKLGWPKYNPDGKLELVALKSYTALLRRYCGL